MKILYFTQFYKPESIAAAFRAEENARAWVRDGHDVTVFTGYPNYPKGEIFPGYQPKLFTQEEMDGVRVLRSKLCAASSRTMIKRMGNALSFFFFGLVNTVFNSKKIGKGFDVVLGTSGIIFAAVLGWFYAATRKLPFVFEIRDISYLQLQVTGRSEKSLAVRLMKWMELFLCRRAKHVVVVTEGFKDVLVSEGIPQEKITVITNGVDVPEQERRQPEGFTLSYFGTLGVSQNIMDTFPYANGVHNRCPNFTYLLIGDGAQKQTIQSALEQGEYPFVKMLPGMDSQALESYYLDTELSVVTLKKDDNFRHTLPSKLFQIMGRGIAVLFIGPEGEAARIVREHDAGIALTGTVEEDLAQLESFFARPDWRQELTHMGERGRNAVQLKYSRSKLAKKYAAVLEQVACREKV